MEIYTELVEKRDIIEKDRVLTGLINNSILQNKLITELQVTSANSGVVGGSNVDPASS